jgi:hypothetical protein
MVPVLVASPARSLGPVFLNFPPVVGDKNWGVHLWSVGSCVIMTPSTNSPPLLQTRRLWGFDAIQKLSKGEMYLLLKHHNTPSTAHVFPATFLAGCNRTFRRVWLDEYPWMVYSEVVDGAFCIACVPFCKSRKGKGKFVNSPFRAWHKKKHQMQGPRASSVPSWSSSLSRWIYSICGEARIIAGSTDGQ